MIIMYIYHILLAGLTTLSHSLQSFGLSLHEKYITINLYCDYVMPQQMFLVIHNYRLLSYCLLKTSLCTTQFTGTKLLFTKLHDKYKVIP